MTLIEFYDKTAIENIAGSLLCKPKRMILIGDSQRRMKNAAATYQSILAKKGIETEITFRSINRNNLQSIVATLEKIVEENEDCTFDLTGGEELYLVAVGIIMNRFQNKIQCHRFNFHNESIIDCDANGSVCATKTADIDVEDNIRIYGGRLISDSSCESFSFPWTFNSDFESDIDSMWKICREKPHAWNKQIGVLGSLCDIFDIGDSLTLSFGIQAANASLEDNARFIYPSRILCELHKKKLINLSVSGDTVSIIFKNEQIKRCLTVSGQILELFVAKIMRSLTDGEGLPLYNDVRVGVVMDWDRVDETDQCQTINEIDVLAIRGVVPVFVSCKNGWFNVNELYKLNSVSKRFGSKYAKMILATTSLDSLGRMADTLRARMEDMGIRCLEITPDKSENDIANELKFL